jgi:hypothetical protein
MRRSGVIKEEGMSETVKKQPKPTAGQYWHVKLPGATCLSTMLVKDITKLTVLLAVDPYGRDSRYMLKDVEMVEKAA